jgi:hypothetical protein
MLSRRVVIKRGLEAKMTISNPFIIAHLYMMKFIMTASNSE